MNLSGSQFNCIWAFSLPELSKHPTCLLHIDNTNFQAFCSKFRASIFLVTVYNHIYGIVTGSIITTVPGTILEGSNLLGIFLLLWLSKCTSLEVVSLDKISTCWSSSGCLARFLIHDIFVVRRFLAIPPETRTLEILVALENAT